MNGRDRILAMLEGRLVDRLPLMPITMMFAGDQAASPTASTPWTIAKWSKLKSPSQRSSASTTFPRFPTRGEKRATAAQPFTSSTTSRRPSTRCIRCCCDKTTLMKLTIPDPLGGGRMHDRVQAVALFRQRIGGERLIEGWVEGPCAEGADLRGINHLMVDFIDDPPFVRDLFDFVLEMALRFGKAQAEAGADLIGVGDAAASLVGPRLYEEFVLPYEKRLVDGLHAMGVKVRLHICGNIRRILPGIATLGCDMVDIDWMVPMEQARRELGPQPALAGNIDPVAVLRNGTPEKVTEAIAHCRQCAGVKYIVGAGCEVCRDTPEANVVALRDCARTAA